MKRTGLILIITLLYCNSVWAANYFRDRTITGVGITYQGDKSVLMFTIDGSMEGQPTCATTNRLALDSSAPHYKEMVALVMAAYAKKDQKVDVYATTTCNYFNNAQDVLALKAGDMIF
jgi:hypothetical protein